MKLYEDEINGFSSVSLDLLKKAKENELSIEQKEFISKKTKNWIKFENKNPTLHFILCTFPLVFNLVLIYLTVTFVISFLFKINFSPILILFLISFILAFLQYSFVAYTLHEGGGHSVFFRNFKNNNIFKLILNQSSRLFFADPIFYSKNHYNHHKYLGTKKDKTFTQFVMKKRLLKALLPGSGVLFKNDFQVYQDDTLTKSRLLSYLIGLFPLLFLISKISHYFNLGQSLFCTLILIPWFGNILERIRECTEHQLMPADPHFGTRELGLGPISFFIVGGPWGQPYHFTHHLAPTLNWYQQIIFHHQLKKILTTEQNNFINNRPKISTLTLFYKLTFIKSLFINYKNF